MTTSLEPHAYERLLVPLEEVPATPAALADRLGSGTSVPPPQEPMEWNLDLWAQTLEVVPDSDAFLSEMRESGLDRAAVVRHVRRAWDDGRTDLAFVAAMVWGYGRSGFGPFRTRRVLCAGGDDLDGTVLTRLREGSDAARRHGPLLGYYTMNNAPGRIRYLGPAFFTKWLYFSSATDGPDDPSAAPILDLRVKRWIAERTGVELRLDRTRDYGRYLQLLDSWGQRPEGTLSRATVERAIFSLT